ncbi:interferon-induced protein 44-like [Brachyhypopomus gauderio]|uniref:interferon-induced protein 44-like n=1 Tax=Brachyhypopomus gauderio TaxID=698409 RepID=UPI00404375CF
MGGNQSKPEFNTVLGDITVGNGEQISLSCEANNTGLTVTWEKDGYELKCVQNKHTMEQNEIETETESKDKKVKVWKTKCSLKIQNADERDQGNYTINLENKLGTASCSAMVIVELNEWRTVQWNQKEMVPSVKEFKIDNDQVRELRFLLYGPVGVGKSSTVNTIRTIFEGRPFVNCLAETAAGRSFTKTYEKYGIANGKEGMLPLAFHDIMGVEKGESAGVRTDDIINAMKGHITEGYVFHTEFPIIEKDPKYRRNPSLSDRIHCLVSVVGADKITMMGKEFINKMRKVREAASGMGIPQVVFMTRVDLACPLTKGNLKKIYRSRKIKELMNTCSNLLGGPTNCIFPLKNYHDETHMNEEINCLMLDALTQIIHWAHDYVVTFSTIPIHNE